MKQGKVHYFIISYLVMAACLSFAGTAYPEADTISLLQHDALQPVERPVESFVIRSVSDRISAGDFEAAEKILLGSKLKTEQAKELAFLIDQYRSIKNKCRDYKQQTFQEKVIEFRKLCNYGPRDDLNDIGKILTDLIRLLEYADDDQEREILKDPVLKEIVHEAQNKAAQSESECNWLDSYKFCYSKLEVIYEDNSDYSVHAKQLLLKSNIASSIKDSLNRERSDRYNAIKKEMFTSAVDVLDSRYVNIIDYNRMALSAVEGCDLLTDVIVSSYLNGMTRYNIRSSNFRQWSASIQDLIKQFNNSTAGMNKERFLQVFENVITLNQNPNYGLNIPEKILIAQFAEASLSSLDPFTAIYWPSEAADLEKMLTNEFSGIGIRFSKEDGVITVLSVLPDTPAYHSGLKTGDIIEKIDGEDTNNISSFCAVKMITGTENSQVTLKIRHPGEYEARDIAVTRAKIIMPSVQGLQGTDTDECSYMIDKHSRIGYIKINSFDARTTDDFEKVLIQLEEDGLRGLILDLRSNTGGLLSSATEVADMFIKKGLIVRVQPRYGVSNYICAHEENTHPDHPMIVLVNHFSASAAEIVAGALRDPKYKRATLVGERTYGKGTVQPIIDCHKDGAKLKYTSAYYYLPSGQQVQNCNETQNGADEIGGLVPCVNVDLNTEELRNIYYAPKANEDSEDSSSGSSAHYSIERILQADTQLAVGMLVLKSKIIKHEL